MRQIGIALVKMLYTNKNKIKKLKKPKQINMQFLPLRKITIMEM